MEGIQRRLGNQPLFGKGARTHPSPKGRIKTAFERAAEIEPKYNAILQQMKILTTEVSEASDKR